MVVLTRLLVLGAIASTTGLTSWEHRESRLHCLLLFSLEESRTSAPGARGYTDYPPGLPAIHPGRHTPLVDLRETGNLRDGGALVAQQEALRSRTGASCGMMGLHLLSGRDCGVAQGGAILHWVCSRSIRWTKAHWDTQEAVAR